MRLWRSGAGEHPVARVTFCSEVASLHWGRGTISNFERWLYQRDQPDDAPAGVTTFPDAQLSQTPAYPSNLTTVGASWMTSVLMLV